MLTCVLAACFFSLTIHSAWIPATEASANWCAVDGDCPALEMQFLQKASSLQPVQPSVLQSKIASETNQEALPELMPLARSLVSEDPEAAAEHLVRYYGARRVASANSSSSCVQTVGVELSRADGEYKTPLDKYTLYFVKDSRKWAGLLSRDFAAKASDAAFRDLIQTGTNASWQGWMDFHDGLTPTLNPFGLNFTHLRNDKVPVQLFHGLSAFDGAWGIGIRFNIPNTSRTLEFDGIDTQKMNALSPEDQEYLSQMQALPTAFGCRNLSVKVMDDDALATLWKKSTYFVERTYQREAYEFAVAALGLEKLTAPYALPPDFECTAALWSRFPGPAKYFQFHLVSTPSWPAKGAALYHRYIGEVRNLESGCFDHYLYDSLILWSEESLDPFVRRLQQLETPFLARKLQGVFSLIFSFPMAPAIVIDIRGIMLSAVDAEEFDPCLETKCRESVR